jgi:hypothetical protein
MKITIGCLLLFLSLLVFYDAYSTFVVIDKGFATEGNPIIHFIIDHIGVLPGLIITKGICLIAIFVLYIRVITNKQINPKEFVIACSMLLSAIICYSYMIYRFNYQNFIGVIY